MNRMPVSELDWFQKSRELAIADVAWVADIGLCSYQPEFFSSIPHGQHRMVDSIGNVHIVTEDKLFCVTPLEIDRYWAEVHRVVTPDKEIKE